MSQNKSPAMSSMAQVIEKVIRMELRDEEPDVAAKLAIGAIFRQTQQAPSSAGTANQADVRTISDILDAIRRMQCMNYPSDHTLMKQAVLRFRQQYEELSDPAKQVVQSQLTISEFGALMETAEEVENDTVEA